MSDESIRAHLAGRDLALAAGPARPSKESVEIDPTRWMPPDTASAQIGVRLSWVRWIAAALAVACGPIAPAMAAVPSDFNATKTGDLVALCSDEPGDPLYAEAKQFCYGFMAGVAQLHRSMVDGESLEPIACPKQEVARDQLVAVFLDWAKANPEAMEALPVESLIQAAGARWPCDGGSAGTRVPSVSGDR